jgi:hypothetical protein
MKRQVGQKSNTLVWDQPRGQKICLLAAQIILCGFDEKM